MLIITQKPFKMKKPKLPVQMSPDSFAGGLNGEPDRKTRNIDDKLNSYIPDPADFATSLIKNNLINVSSM